MRNFLLRHFVGNDQQHAITFCSGDERQTEARVASGCLDHRAPQLQFSLSLGRFDHGKRNSVLDRAGGILVLEFYEKLAWPGVDPRDFDERGITDERKDRWRTIG